MPSPLLLCILSLGSVCHILSTAPPPAYPTGGPHYYRSSAHYFIPMRPVEPLSPQQAAEMEKNGVPVNVAYFDNQHRIIVFEAHRKDGISRATYEYFPDHLLQRLTNFDGSTSSRSYPLEGWHP